MLRCALAKLGSQFLLVNTHIIALSSWRCFLKAAAAILVFASAIYSESTIFILPSANLADRRARSAFIFILAFRGYEKTRGLAP